MNDPTISDLNNVKWWDENAPNGYDYWIDYAGEAGGFHYLQGNQYYDYDGCYYDIGTDPQMVVYKRPTIDGAKCEVFYGGVWQPTKPKDFRPLTDTDEMAIDEIRKIICNNISSDPAMMLYSLGYRKV